MQNQLGKHGTSPFISQRPPCAPFKACKFRQSQAQRKSTVPCAFSSAKQKVTSSRNGQHQICAKAYSWHVFIVRCFNLEHKVSPIAKSTGPAQNLKLLIYFALQLNVFGQFEKGKRSLQRHRTPDVSADVSFNTFIRANRDLHFETIL